MPAGKKRGDFFVDFWAKEECFWAIAWIRMFTALARWSRYPCQEKLQCWHKEMGTGQPMFGQVAQVVNWPGSSQRAKMFGSSLEAFYFSGA